MCLRGELMSPIKAPYLLCVCVPISIDGEGRRWTDELWAKDLALHLDYLEDLTLAGPVVKNEPGVRDICLNQPPFNRLKFIDLPYPRTHLGAIWALPEYVYKLWKGTREAAIVHSGFGGWPFAEGWFLTPIGKLQNKLAVTNLESSFWRERGHGGSWLEKLRSFLKEQLTRFTVRIADLRFFTSEAYAADFLPENAPRAFVVPAAWINEEWILSQERAAAAWDAKAGATRLIFAGRLVESKGVEILLQAIDQATDAHLDITIMGEGPLRDRCIRGAEAKHGSINLRFLDPVSYGEPFLSTLRGHDAVLLPSLSSEQPRVVLDAFSQAVPVIGSETGGICEFVQAGVNGLLVPPGDTAALAQVLTWASHNRADLRKLGMTALEGCGKATHSAMHARRHEILLNALAQRSGPEGTNKGGTVARRQPDTTANCASVAWTNGSLPDRGYVISAADRASARTSPPRVPLDQPPRI